MAQTNADLNWLGKHLPVFCCPACRADLVLRGEDLSCAGCGRSFDCSGGIPRLFWPNEDWAGEGEDVTDAIQAFYEETPFPDYDDFDSVASLVEKARQGMFAKLLDDQVPSGVRVLECGWGTGQLSNFLSVANRSVFGSDLCLGSLELAQEFKQRNELSRAHFVQMNLFRPVFKPASFDLVISNGVLHHTADPFLAFRTISTLVKPGGYVLVGLYHRYGRLVTDLRRWIFRLSGDRFAALDPNLRQGGMQGPKRRAWFMDQYKNPHESKHTIGEVMRWLREADLDFVKSIPRSRPFQPIGPGDSLFAPEEPGNALERLAVELGMIGSGSGEGGFFVVIGKKPRQAASPPAQKSV